MVAQGVLNFQYEAEGSKSGLTGFAGLPVYLDLIQKSGLVAAIRRHVVVAGRQGWLDLQMVLALLFLNLAGGDCVEDLERLEGDSGFAAILRSVEREILTRRERRSLKTRWRRPRERAAPSPSATSGWLERFHDPAAAAAMAAMATAAAAAGLSITERTRCSWRARILALGRSISTRYAISAGHGF